MREERSAREAPQAAQRVFGLDGLRALAIGGVLVSHLHMVFWGEGAGFAAVAGGLGVELFFVLSGFLIGGLLLAIVEHGPDLRAWAVFLVRRWMRTLPLYFLWLLVLLLAAPPRDGSAWHFFLMVQNLAWPMVSDWFPVSWSLAVEEWFYLLFSVVLLGVAPWMGQQRAVAVSCGLFLVAAPMARWLADAPGVDWDASLRKVVVLRMDAIAYGVLMAWVHRCWQGAWQRLALPAVIFGIGLAGFAGSAALWPQGWAQSAAWRSFGFCVLAAGLALCLPAILRLPAPGGALERAVVWTSQRSYGMYIVHLSLMEVARQAIVGGLLSAKLGVLLACVAVVVAAELAYRLVEQPVLARRPWQFQLGSGSVACKR